MLKYGKTVVFQSGTSLEKLENQVYTINKDGMGNLFLLQIEPFQYMEMDGNAKNIESIVLNHHNRHPGSFGCIFDGISGMGKTQNIKNICIKFGLPVLFVDTEIHGTDIRKILDMINTDCVLFFDEFEKLYDDSDHLLSLFDGVKTRNKVITFVSFNEEKNLSRYFFGRPGRFVFRFKYNPLETNQASQFILSRVDGLEEKKLMKFLDKIDNLSYDICDKIVKIIKLHPEQKIEDLSKYLNIEMSDYKILISLYENNNIIGVVRNLEEDDDEFRVYHQAFYGNTLDVPEEISNLDIGDTFVYTPDSTAIKEEFASKNYTLHFTKIKNVKFRGGSFGY